MTLTPLKTLLIIICIVIWIGLQIYLTRSDKIYKLSSTRILYLIISLIWLVAAIIKLLFHEYGGSSLYFVISCMYAVIGDARQRTK